jgi:2-polyprenyl-3-methyl-5-hydroxy-6-metoxy-1,4-benzoquinol methylase
MLGHNYSAYPEVLADSYQKIGQNSYKISPVLKQLQRIYIQLFGIPEIGFQLRGKYFLKTLNSIKSFSPNNILDAGSGIGYYSQELNKLFPQASVYGIDIDKYKLDFCKNIVKDRQLKKIEFNFKNLEQDTLPANKYDLIVNIDVLEHVRDYQHILKKFYSAMAKKGYLYIHTPQVNQVRIFKKYFSNWSHEEHVREGFDKQDMAALLKHIGFSSIEIHEGFGLFGKIAWELNTLLMDKSIILGGLAFPILYFISLGDQILFSGRGLTLYILAKK